MIKLNYLDNIFFDNYFNRTGFWYTFKRSVNNIDNLYLLLKHMENFSNKNWFKNQKEYSNILIKEKILAPTKSSGDPSANSRGIKKVLESLGFCYVEQDETLQITRAGRNFLSKGTTEELYQVKTNQLLKYQINNPLIKIGTYKDLKIKPFTFLLNLLLKLENQSIDNIEYKLFVCRAHTNNELDLIIKQINEWRSISEEQKIKILEKVSSNPVYKNINAYSSYSLSFFGKSSFTDIAEIDEEKILFLKKNKIIDVENVLNIENIHVYEENLDNSKKFIEYYGGYEGTKIETLEKIQKKGEHNDKEKILSQKIEDIFFLSGRTLNLLKKEQIICLKDLLLWEVNELSRMQGMGQGLINEILSQLKEFNIRNKTSFSFYSIKNKNYNQSDYKKDLFRRIDEFEWSIRTMNVFMQEKIIFIGDLVHLTEQDLLKYPKFGKQSLVEVKNVLEKMELELGQISIWPPEESDFIEQNLKINNSKKFDELSTQDQINLFKPIDKTFENIRIINVCINANLDSLGDLHQNILKLDKLNNLGAKSIEEIKISLRRFISFPIGIVIEDWDEIKAKRYEEYKAKLAKFEKL